jgi:hypothetical protein
MDRRSYEIRLEGHLAADWSDWFEGLAVCQEADGNTTLFGTVDQAALHGILTRIRDLGLVLISVNGNGIGEPRDSTGAGAGNRGMR